MPLQTIPPPAATALVDPYTAFLDTSVVLTGFERFDLLGTGVSRLYFNYIYTKVEFQTFLQLLTRVTAAISATPADLAGPISVILEDPDLGPLARQIIKLWYTGQWFESADSTDNPIVSTESYQQGLVWLAIEAHPAGSKQQGFAAWSEPFKPILPIARIAPSSVTNGGKA